MNHYRTHMALMLTSASKQTDENEPVSEASIRSIPSSGSDSDRTVCDSKTSLVESRLSSCFSDLSPGVNEAVRAPTKSVGTEVVTCDVIESGYEESPCEKKNQNDRSVQCNFADIVLELTNSKRMDHIYRQLKRHDLANPHTTKLRDTKKPLQEQPSNDL
ncbi:hypothetical protein FGIG_10584 [Fasciola gigantica]|uniref:Uncharacterized protein n=1 Tax=Fasciola gigantica TaxID=46835 RepID=A0A504Z9Y9_FASGI|nr:hypothetical protein FGIG_10584 [Fasciola gigantica]